LSKLSRLAGKIGPDVLDAANVTPARGLVPSFYGLHVDSIGLVYFGLDEGATIMSVVVLRSMTFTMFKHF
jgi:hypothetical protein